MIGRHEVVIHFCPKLVMPLCVTHFDVDIGHCDRDDESTNNGSDDSQ